MVVLLLLLLTLLHYSAAFTLHNKVRDMDESKEDIMVVTKALEVKQVPPCWTEEKPKFHLLTRPSEDLEHLAHLVILIHGFYSRPAVWADHLARLVLEKDERKKQVGVIVVDWEESSRWKNVFEPWSDYSKAVKNTGCLAEIAASVLQRFPVRPSVHCVGHSLGAHICGFISNLLEEEEGRRMERITGLDPAGIDWTTKLAGVMKVEPMEVVPHVDTRLDASDADFVDVLHTDANFAGMMEPCGNVDFYIGRTMEGLGSSQKGCGCKDNCDHAQSFRLFTQSVSQPLEASKMFQCKEAEKSSLENCQEISKAKQPRVGYFATSGERGLVGVLTPSDAVEMPCLADIEEEEEEVEKEDEE